MGSILSTNRDYKRIYFITNQFVSDKERSTQEDILSNNTGIPVHIIDRSWIVEKIYKDDLLDIAITALGIEGAQIEKKSRLGPNDTKRLAELEELDRQIADPSRYQGARYQLVEDCLRSAILARELERPRNEVESRFARVDRLAQDLDYRPQRLRIAYIRAWTAFWWHEDYYAFGLFYDEVEMRVEGSVQASEIELLQNLWLLLAPSVDNGHISALKAKIESRRQNLVSFLDAIAVDPTRPNNSMRARTGLTLMRITQAFQTGQSDLLELGWRELSQIVDESATLGEYSLELLYKILTIFGEITDSKTFDALYEKIVEAIRQRSSDGEAGKAYIQRGAQKLQHGMPYDAIQLFGRAEELLFKEEYRAELVKVLIASGYAFERVGLLWAARNKVLAAVERCFAIFNEEGKVITPALNSLNRLVWLELQLGRIPHVLSAMNLANIVASNLKMTEEWQKAYDEERLMQEAVLGIHFLNLPIEDISSLSLLPDALERLGLTIARMSLLFSLGQEQVLRDEGDIPADQSSSGVQSFFEKWQDQPAAMDIPKIPVMVDGPTSLLKSIILGSEFVVETSNNAVSFGVAESLIGALEAFLATSDEQDVMPYYECINIIVRESDQLTDLPQTCFLDDTTGCIEIIHPKDMAFATTAKRQYFINWLRDSLLEIASRVLAIYDVHAWLEKITNQERGFTRALVFGDVLTLEKNIFGEKAYLCLKDWIRSDDRDFPALRTGPWRMPKSHDQSIQDVSLKLGDGMPPAEMFDRSLLKHSDRRILSPIDLPFWDRAKWLAVMYDYHPELVPILALVFQDGLAGQDIFRAWIKRLGDEDEDNVIRLTIITGLSKQTPADYAIVVGPNISLIENCMGKMFGLVSRIIRMTPSNSNNLNNFISAYQREGAFLLAPAQEDKYSPTLFEQLVITKWHLQIRQAWQIGENDPDIIALQEDDDPIIPACVADPPVYRSLARIRAFRQADRRSQ